MENLFNTKIKTFQTDGGGEYLNNAFKTYFDTHGILPRYTCPHHPEQNGMAEHKHRHLVETGLTLLVHAKMPPTYWAEAFHTANYLISRLPTKVLKLVSPYTKLFQRDPTYEILKVFGCACFPYLRPYNNNKLPFRSCKCIFLGYSLNQLGYRCLDPQTIGEFFFQNM